MIEFGDLFSYELSTAVFELISLACLAAGALVVSVVCRTKEPRETGVTGIPAAHLR